MEIIDCLCYNNRDIFLRNGEIMLNEGKVKMMTKMAAYEKHDGKKDIAICRFFKSDYIGLELLKSGVMITFAYLLCVTLYIVCNIDRYLRDLGQIDLNAFLMSVGKVYLIILIIFTIIGYMLYSYRYDMAKKNIQTYSKRLKKLEKYYKLEEKNKGR